jgi:hypothetical protein
MQRFFFLGEVETDEAVLGLAEEAAARDARHAYLADEPLGGFGIGGKAEG